MKEAAPPATRTIGRYEVLSELGQGAMGTVLLCRDPVLGRDVALKYLRTDLRLPAVEREQLMRRMRQEAQAVAQVSHRGIVSLYDIGEDPEVGTYLVFERVSGPTLDAVLRRGRLTKEGAARLAKELGNALDAAHAVGILHRDIKPSNVILTASGAKVADFGVARLPDSTLTRAGARVGTPAYSAPESIRDGIHSIFSDQFSMAACLYEALSGRRAYPGQEAIEVARRIQRESPLPIAQALGLDSKVDTVLLRGMASDTADRYASCRQLGSAFSEAILGAREVLPTLPDEQVLLRHDDEDRGQKVGFAVLGFLVGAILSIGFYRFILPKFQDAPASTPHTLQAPPLRPAVLSQLPQNLTRGQDVVEK